MDVVACTLHLNRAIQSELVKLICGIRSLCTANWQWVNHVIGVNHSVLYFNIYRIDFKKYIGCVEVRNASVETGKQ